MVLPSSSRAFHLPAALSNVSSFLLAIFFFIIVAFQCSNGQTVEYSPSGSDDDVSSDITQDSPKAGSNGTTCAPAPVQKSTSVGIIIGVLLGGMVIGSLLTIVVIRCRKKRESQWAPPPPKDYNAVDTARFDVNRNNDDNLYSSAGTTPTADDSRENGHRKLERLIKPKDVPSAVFEISTAATPLIHNEDVEAQQAEGASISRTEINSTDSDVNLSKIPAKAASSGVSSDLYLNAASEGKTEQPYDSLEIIPEEVEYENFKQNEYMEVKESRP